MRRSPFKFLDSYTKEDKAIFFGKDIEITEILQKCANCLRKIHYMKIKPNKEWKFYADK